MSHMTVSGNAIVPDEEKMMKIVRTVSGARRYRQPKGSIIVRDGNEPLDGLVALPNDREGWEKVADLNGNIFYIGHIGEEWVVENAIDGSIAKKLETSEDAFQWLNEQVGGQAAPAPKQDKPPLPAQTSDTARMRAEKQTLNDPVYKITISQGSALGVLTESELSKYRQLRDRGLNHNEAYKASREGKPTGNTSTKKKSMTTEEEKVHGHRTLERAPGDNDNWVERAGQLPPYIEHIAQALHERKGFTISRAIATAINRVKRWAAGLDNVTAKTRAKAIKALAQWTALKAKNAARKKK